MARFWRSLRCAWQGWLWVARAERNFRFELAAAALAALCGWLLKIAPGEWLALILCIALVLSSELMNSALEQLANAYSVRPDERIRRIKDAAAGATLAAAVGSALVGLAIFGPKLWAFL